MYKVILTQRELIFSGYNTLVRSCTKHEERLDVSRMINRAVEDVKMTEKAVNIKNGIIITSTSRLPLICKADQISRQTI